MDPDDKKTNLGVAQSSSFDSGSQNTNPTTSTTQNPVQSPQPNSFDASQVGFNPFLNTQSQTPSGTNPQPGPATEAQTINTVISSPPLQPDVSSISQFPQNPPPATTPQPAVPEVQPTQAPPTQPTDLLASNQPVDLSVSEPIAETQQIIANTDPTPTSKPKSKLPKILLIIFAALFLLGGAGTVALAFLITYDVYRLPFAPDAQDKLKYAVMSLPFTPKTPEFIVEKSLFAHKNIASHDFELSAAFDAPELGGILSLGKLDAVVTGDISYKDPINVLTNLDVSLTKDLNFNIKIKDKIVYFKINQIPSEITTLYEQYGGGESLDKYLEKWYFIDTQPLESEARTQLDSTKDDKPVTDLIIEKTLSFMKDKKIQSAVKLENADHDENKVFKLSINADDDLTDYIFEKLSDGDDDNLVTQAQNKLLSQSQVLGIDSNIYTQDEEEPEPSKPSDLIKNFYLEAMFDKRSYLLRRSLISFDVVFEEKYVKELYATGLFSNPLTNEDIKMRFSLATKFDDFGKDVQVEVPEDATDFDELTKELLGYSIKEQRQKADDTTRLSHIVQLTMAIKSFYAACLRYPNTLEDLVKESISYCPNIKDVSLTQVPVDPKGNEYFYSVNESGSEYHLCAKMNDPNRYSFQKSPYPCPDPSYNFHISSIDPTPTPYRYNYPNDPYLY